MESKRDPCWQSLWWGQGEEGAILQERGWVSQSPQKIFTTGRKWPAANSGIFCCCLLVIFFISPLLSNWSILHYTLGCWNLDEKGNKVKEDSNFSLNIICRIEPTDTSRLPSVFCPSPRAWRSHRRRNTQVRSVAWRRAKALFLPPQPPSVAFQSTTLWRKPQTGDAINCAQRKKGGVERLEMKKDLIAGKLVQINETMRALTSLMDVSG